MIVHHIQKKIISDLVEARSARFTDLKPHAIDSNVFTYHIQSLTKLGMIEKYSNGVYQLTSKGMLYGINSSLEQKDILKQAHPVLLIVIRDGERWLLRKRTVQPMFGKLGFIHGEPRADETIEVSARRELLRRTGLTAGLSVKGFGFIMCQKTTGL
jgi:predicted transcriptional regulator